MLKLIFGIDPAETTFARRGFRGGSQGVREHLERVGPAFVAGYHAALEEDDVEKLAERLWTVPLNWQGFAFEGAAMGLGLRDRLTPWRRNRVRRFLEGPGADHTYMVHVALGWVLARMPGRVERSLEPLDPLLRWLVLDGYGFHEGFFHWPKYVGGGAPPRRVAGYGCRAFDQGLGRSLWFVEGGEVPGLQRTIAAFASERHGDLWSGVGLAAVYAGGADEAGQRALVAAAGPHHPQLAQGAAFAAKARHRAGNPTPETDRACWSLCGMASADAAAITDAALENLPMQGAEPAYELWRQRIQRAFTNGKEISR